MEPDLELVQLGAAESFKVWSHGYPFRTVRWHFHPEYELHLVTATRGNRYVGDHVGSFERGDLVLAGPNLPHNWISDVPQGAMVAERCLVLQFSQATIDGAIAGFAELAALSGLLRDAHRGVMFDAATAARVEPRLRAMLTAQGPTRVGLFFAVLGELVHAGSRRMLASPGFQPEPTEYLSASLNSILQHIGASFTQPLSEVELAAMARQSVSAFSRAFRRHTGTSFVRYVNALRIALACQHLRQSRRKITDICYAVGFNNVSNFNRQFMAAKGMSPSRFRSIRLDRAPRADAGWIQGAGIVAGGPS